MEQTAKLKNHKAQLEIPSCDCFSFEKSSWTVRPITDSLWIFYTDATGKFKRLLNMTTRTVSFHASSVKSPTKPFQHASTRPPMVAMNNIRSVASNWLELWRRLSRWTATGSFSMPCADRLPRLLQHQRHVEVATVLIFTSNSSASQ